MRRRAPRCASFQRGGLPSAKDVRCLHRCEGSEKKLLEQLHWNVEQYGYECIGCHSPKLIGNPERVPYCPRCLKEKYPDRICRACRGRGYTGLWAPPRLARFRSCIRCEGMGVLPKTSQRVGR